MRVQKTEKGPFFLLFPHHYVGGGIGGSGGQCSSNQDCVVSAPFCSKWGYCQVLIMMIIRMFSSMFLYYSVSFKVFDDPFSVQLSEWQQWKRRWMWWWRWRWRVRSSSFKSLINCLWTALWNVECHNLFRGCGSYGCGGGGCGSCGRKKKREALEKLIDTYQKAEDPNEEQNWHISKCTRYRS